MARPNRPMMFGEKLENPSRHARESRGVGRMNIHKYKGFLIGLISMCFYSSSTVGVTLLKGKVDVFLLSFIRVVEMAIFCSTIIIYKNIIIWPCTKKEMVLTFLSSLASSVAGCIQFYSYQNMHPANASAILYGYITFIAFFARLFLKERLGLLEVATVIVTLSGVLLIAQPPFIFGNQKHEDIKSVQDVPGTLLVVIALCGSITLAVLVVILRAIARENIHPSRTLFYHSLFSCLIMFPVVTLLQKWSIPSCIVSRFLTAMTGLLSCLGTFFLNYALTMENAVYVGLATVNQVFVICIIDFIFFGLVLEWLNMFGMVLIVGSSLIITSKRVCEARTETNRAKTVSINVVENDDAE